MSQKVWFITGASRGFGKEFVLAALEAGDCVIATSRDAATITAATGTSDNLLALPLDVTKPEMAAAAVQAGLDKFGRIDVLVNNAGYGIIGAVEETSSEEVSQQFQTNVFGLIDVTRAVLPTLRKQRSGHILNIGSVGGIITIPAASMYCASKFAVEAISEVLAGEVAPLGIRVTVVEPGYFRTDFLEPSSIYFTKTEIADYAETSGVSRKVVPTMSHTQSGDPRKLALALVKIVNMPDPPFRFAAGADAVAMINAKLVSLKQELDRWQELSSAMAID